MNRNILFIINAMLQSIRGFADILEELNVGTSDADIL